MTAQRTRMDVVTENLANTDTTVTASGRPYQRKVVVLRTADGAFGDALRVAGAPQGGVTVDGIVESDEAPRRVHQPGHPQARVGTASADPPTTVVVRLFEACLR
jgi:flagellar basal-body rod protein FlgC